MEGHVTLDRNPGPGYNTLLLRLILGDILSACPHSQFQTAETVHGILDSWAALPNSYPNALRSMQGGSLYHFYDGLWYDPAGARTRDLPLINSHNYNSTCVRPALKCCLRPTFGVSFDLRGLNLSCIIQMRSPCAIQ